MKEVVANYRNTLLKRMIILCWIFLFICFVVKIFGGNFFNVVCSNKNFINICNLIDNSFILYFIVSLIFNFSMSILFIVAIDSKLKPSKLQVLYLLIICSVISFLKVYFINTELYAYVNILDILHIISFVFVVKRKSNLISAMVQYIIFMAISNFTKGFSLNISNEPILVSLIMSIGVLIMLALLYLYSNKKGDIFMGALFIFLSKEKAQLEAYKKVLTDNHNKKVAKLNVKHDNKVAKIDARIEKINKK